MAVDLSRFRNKVNQQDLEEQKKRFEGQRNYTAIPSGVYMVDLEKLEMAKSSWGSDQVNITFKILEGEYKGRLLFYNGTFEEPGKDHFAHGKPVTATLIQDMVEGENTREEILALLDEDPETVKEYMVDFYQDIKSKGICFELDYKEQEAKAVNPNTGKPYVNRFFHITGVFDK